MDLVDHNKAKVTTLDYKVYSLHIMPLPSQTKPVFELYWTAMSVKKMPRVGKRMIMHYIRKKANLQSPVYYYS